MTLPQMNITVLDPGLGLVTPSANSPLLLGVSSLGTVGQLYSFSSLNTIRSTLGYGELAEDVAKHLSEGGSPVLAMRSAGSVAAVTSAVTQTGTGPAVTLAGTATTKAAGRIEMLSGGARGVATFRFTLDRFQPNDVNPTWSATRTVPSGGSFVIPGTGITATFPTGTYVTGDTYDFTLDPPRMNASDLAALGTALANYPTVLFPQLTISDVYATASEGFAMCSAAASLMTTLAGGYRYARAHVDCGSGDSTSNILTAAAAFADRRVDCDYGYVLYNSLLAFEGYSVRKAASGAGISARSAGQLPSTDLARYASGNLPGVQYIYFDGNSDQTLDDAGISTLRRWPGISGFYIANGRLKAPLGSDFTKWQYGRVMDIGCRTVYEAMLPFIAEGFRTNSDGTIDDRDAIDVENAGLEALKNSLLRTNNARGVAGQVSAVGFKVDRTVNINAIATLQTKIGIRPLGYANTINQEIGYSLNV